MMKYLAIYDKNTGAIYYSRAPFNEEILPEIDIVSVEIDESLYRLKSIDPKNKEPVTVEKQIKPDSLEKKVADLEAQVNTLLNIQKQNEGKK